MTTNKVSWFYESASEASRKENPVTSASAFNAKSADGNVQSFDDHFSSICEGYK